MSTTISLSHVQNLMLNMDRPTQCYLTFFVPWYISEEKKKKNTAKCLPKWHKMKQSSLWSYVILLGLIVMLTQCKTARNNKRHTALSHFLFSVFIAVRLEKKSSQKYVVENLRCRWCLSLLETTELLKSFFSPNIKHKRIGAVGSPVK